mmetsp:Transcript_3741/g.10628  ORF Transcript_3741/g.10628 Transcript_3741/m.10628 type:complete len:219 (-) Transcript_3741:115-771(-)
MAALRPVALAALCLLALAPPARCEYAFPSKLVKTHEMTLNYPVDTLWKMMMKHWPSKTSKLNKELGALVTEITDEVPKLGTVRKTRIDPDAVSTFKLAAWDLENEETVVEFDEEKHIFACIGKDHGLGVTGAGGRLTMTDAGSGKTTAKVDVYYDMDEDLVLKTIDEKGGVTGAMARWFPETSKSGLRKFIKDGEDSAVKNGIEGLDRIMAKWQNEEL